MSDQPPTPQPPDPPATPEPEPPYSPSEEERTAHQAYLDSILPAVGRRIDVLITTTVQQSGHGDYAVWLPLYALDRALRNLIFTHDAAGRALPAPAVLENDAKLHLLAAVALERYASRLRARVGTAVSRIQAGANLTEPLPTVEWVARDQSLCYDDALEQFGELLPAPEKGPQP